MRKMITMVTMIISITMMTAVTANTGNAKSHDLRRSGYFCNCLISKALDWIVTIVIKVTTG